MGEEEKAIELYEKHFYCDFLNDDESCKKHAKITVDFIIENLIILSDGNFTFIHEVGYWKRVKKEIDKI